MGHNYFGYSIWLLPALLAYFFVVFYVYAPLKIRRNQIKDVIVEHTPVELSELPASVVHAFHTAARGLVPCGFQAVGHVRQHVAKTCQDGFVSLWVNRSSGDSARSLVYVRHRPLA